MQSLDQYITQRFANDTLKKIYVTQEEFDILKAWIKRNCANRTEYYGRYEQYFGRYPKGERDFYVASNRIVVEYHRNCFRNIYENIRFSYLLKYEIVVK